MLQQRELLLPETPQAPWRMLQERLQVHLLMLLEEAIHQEGLPSSSR